VNGPVRAELDRYGLTAQLGADAIFLSIDDALTAFDQLPPPSPSPSDRSPTTDDDAADSRDG
jgi:hypothetical protein